MILSGENLFQALPQVVLRFQWERIKCSLHSITTIPTGSVVNSDPAFVNPYSDWHRLASAERLHWDRNGLNLYATPAADYDFDGNPRPPSPTAWDIGAYIFKPQP